MTEKLINLYQDLADFTKPKCEACHNQMCSRLKVDAATFKPNRCCDPHYCAIAKQSAIDFGGTPPEPTGHPTLPYMGEKGCIMPPHYRHLCTAHVCSMNSVGIIEDPKGRMEPDEEATLKYFELTNAIDEEWLVPTNAALFNNKNCNSCEDETTD
ncbi:MAG: hypothetical protein ABW007_19050 [Chitinophagaceae bacterium]